MSSTTATSSPTSSGSSSPIDPITSPILSSQAALYLYTFLVTLILLLAVSAAIVVRSFILRRRHRRMIEEAIRNGTYIPSLRFKRGVGEKPQLHDVYINVDDARIPNDEERDKLGWCESLMPVAISIMKPDVTTPVKEGSVVTTVASSRAVNHTTRGWLPFRRGPAQTNNPNTLPPALLSSSSGEQSSSYLHSTIVTSSVTVLVAMPTPPQYKEKLRTHHRQSSSSTSRSSDTEVPFLEFGIAEIPLDLKEDGQVPMV